MEYTLSYFSVTILSVISPKSIRRKKSILQRASERERERGREGERKREASDATYIKLNLSDGTYSTFVPGYGYGYTSEIHNVHSVIKW